MFGDDRWLRRIFIALAVLSCLPIFVVRYHPLTDLGSHLASISVLRHLHDPAWGYDGYYQLSLGFAPYWVHYGLTWLLSYVVGLDVANRLLLSVFVVGLPLAATIFVKQLGRSPWLGLFAFPFVWSYSFFWGFINCVLGFALALCALALFDRFCERRAWGTGVAAALLGGGIYFCHLLPFAFFVGGAGLVGLAHAPRDRRRLAERFLVWSLAVGIGAIGYRLGTVLHIAAVRASRTELRFYPVQTNLERLIPYTWGHCAAHVDWMLAGLLAVAWIGLKLSEPRQRWRLADFRVELCFLVAGALYFVMPRSVLAPKYWWGVNLRYAWVMVLLFALSVKGAIAGRRRWWLAPVVVASLGMIVDVAVHFRRSQAFIDGFDRLGAIPEPGARILWVVAEPWHDPSFTFEHARATPSLHQAFHGGYNPYNFDEGFPLKYKTRYPTTPWNRPNFDWKDAPYYDYAMFFQYDGRRLFAQRPDVKLIGLAGRWQLWKLPGPRVDKPPKPPY